MFPMADVCAPHGRATLGQTPGVVKQFAGQRPVSHNSKIVTPPSTSTIRLIAHRAARTEF
jgi:hypothetical protein